MGKIKLIFGSILLSSCFVAPAAFAQPSTCVARVDKAAKRLHFRKFGSDVASTASVSSKELIATRKNSLQDNIEVYFVEMSDEVEPSWWVLSFTNRQGKCEFKGGHLTSSN